MSPNRIFMFLINPPCGNVRIQNIYSNKKITQTVVINIVFKRIFIELDVSYASQHTFSKVTVTIFEN